VTRHARETDTHWYVEPALLDGLVIGLDDPAVSGEAEGVPLMLVAGGAGSDLPDPLAVATALRSAIDTDRPVIVTGASVLTSAAVGAIGLLNVLAAVRFALNGAEVPELTELLRSDDVAELQDIMTRMSSADSGIVRAFCPVYRTAEPAVLTAALAAVGLASSA